MSKKENRGIKRVSTAATNSYEKKWRNKDNYETFWETESTIQ